VLLFFKIYWLIFFRTLITPDCSRDTRTILQPTRNSILICGWRLRCPVDLIEIGFIISQTLRLKICEWAIVYRPLIPRNRVRAPNLQLSKQLYKSKLKLRQPGFVPRWLNLGSRRPNLGDCTRRCCQTLVVRNNHRHLPSPDEDPPSPPLSPLAFVFYISCIQIDIF
jgi:hypothetical protein